LAVLAALGASAGPAAAEPPFPPFNGATSFPAINGPLDPEEFSWEVELDEGQEMKAIDDQHAAIYAEDGLVKSTITAGPAHDAVGKTVPTSLRVEGANIITFTVHHRAGNPAAGGAQFAYPVTAGAGWEGGFSTVVILGPPNEQQIREERERRQRAEWEAALRQDESEGCRVPRLHGLSLKASARRLQAAGCALGKVRGERSKAARVVRQDVAVGKRFPSGTGISVKLSA
jgi:hypothetical protein